MRKAPKFDLFNQDQQRDIFDTMPPEFAPKAKPREPIRREQPSDRLRLPGLEPQS